MAFQKTLNSHDLVRLKADIDKYPTNWKRVEIVKEINKKWRMNARTLDAWCAIVQGIPESKYPLYDQLGHKRMTELAYTQVKNPAHKEFLIDKVLEEGLSLPEVIRVKDHIHRGRHPIEAIDIVKGRRSEKPLTKGDQLTLGKLIRDLERTGIDWRVTCETLRKMGQIQLVQKGQLVLDLLNELTSIKVAVDDMHRYVDEVMAGIPKELVDALVSEYRGTAPKNGDAEFRVIETTPLPAPKAEEAAL